MERANMTPEIDRWPFLSDNWCRAFVFECGRSRMSDTGTGDLPTFKPNPSTVRFLLGQLGITQGASDLD